jgi:hypothetical protein
VTLDGLRLFFFLFHDGFDAGDEVLDRLQLPEDEPQVDILRVFFHIVDELFLHSFLPTSYLSFVVYIICSCFVEKSSSFLVFLLCYGKNGLFCFYWFVFLFSQQEDSGDENDDSHWQEDQRQDGQDRGFESYLDVRGDVW